MRNMKAVLAILQGRAIVIVKRDEQVADVTVGKNVNKQFAISSMVGALRAVML